MTGEAQITVVCSCGKKLKAPATSAGKKARCPACGAVVRLIPGESVASALATARSAAPAAAASPSPARVGGDKPRTSTAPRKPPAPTRREKPVQTDLSDQDPDGLSALYELSEQAETAAVVPDAPMCPSCRARMDSNAVLCTSCGYDTRSGKAIKTAKAAPAANAAAPWGKGKSKKQAVDRMAPDGSFMIGLLIARRHWAGLGRCLGCAPRHHWLFSHHPNCRSDWLDDWSWPESRSERLQPTRWNRGGDYCHIGHRRTQHRVPDCRSVTGPRRPARAHHVQRVPRSGDHLRRCRNGRCVQDREWSGVVKGN